MADDIIRIKTISQLHEVLGVDKPKHPLISLIDASVFEVTKDMVGMRSMSDFYMVSLKDKSCGMQYGRNYYDFDEGVLSFSAPGQVYTARYEVSDIQGWMLVFHPDIIRQSNLGKNIDNYTFFSYDVHEALHLSADEEKILEGIVKGIEFEYNNNIDGHTQGLFASSIELLLNYCMRFYERQFHTRTNQNKDVVSTVERLIKQYFDDNKQNEIGSLNPAYLANQVNLSANYLGDLLKKETGRNTKDHINDYIVDKAKTMLLNSNSNVNEIAYDLGFNYPHYFSRLFKQKTGTTPQKFRDVNYN